MKTSQDRILTTHCGSLPRNGVLSDLLRMQENGVAIDEGALAREMASAVQWVVGNQIDAGLDVVNDGEQPRVGFQTYVPQRMSGFGGQSSRPMDRDSEAFPIFAARKASRFPQRSKTSTAPQAIGELAYTDLSAAKMECELLEQVVRKSRKPPAECFMTAAAPGIIATTMVNAYYDTHERYVFAIAREMQKEYELIASHGFVLQLDAPDLAMERTMYFKDKSDPEFVSIVEMHVEAINRAIANIPREQIRLHCCWGNWEGPHIFDIALSKILPALYGAKVGALNIEFANARHQHEYAAFREHPLPPEMILIPGVIDSTSNFVEHPRVVANRIREAVAAVGDRTRVIAGTDCGFGTHTGAENVAEDVVWAKLRSMKEGADIATRELWG